jgi:hypothetical protein
MGEIKSTLDIIMEKTKGLSMSDEEKKVFQKKEVEGKVRGLVQKFQDGRMDLEGLKTEIDTFEEGQYEMAREALIKECLDRIDPEADNKSVLSLLEHVVEVDPNPFHKILSEFQKDLEKEKDTRERTLRERLQEEGISGSAVSPNVEADQEWNQYMLKLKKDFKEKENRLK